MNDSFRKAGGENMKYQCSLRRPYGNHPRRPSVDRRNGTVSFYV